LITISRDMQGGIVDCAGVALTIYFSGSITGGRADVEHYRRIVDALRAEGFAVLAGSVAAAHVGSGGDALPPREVFARDLAWLAAAQVLVAEVSMPSLGVGYEIATARYRYGIPVIALYRPAHTARCSSMISGDDGVTLLEYDENRFAEMLETLVNKLHGLAVTGACLP
jgi:hypothetical protein